MVIRFLEIWAGLAAEWTLDVLGFPEHLILVLFVALLHSYLCNVYH
jgi:hypothetical protein